ncbi:MAG: hypothetical protein BWK78_03495 [Thiotrichaceae bacterium IS1]|nr:MAG: hypothetical protein BWK78_03495 [Thiotrichaceae bacterium IS1]
MNVIKVKNAPLEDFNELMVWLAEYENEQWDKQIRQDYQTGKLDKLIQDVMVDIENGDVKSQLTL